MFNISHLSRKFKILSFHWTLTRSSAILATKVHEVQERIQFLYLETSYDFIEEIYRSIYIFEKKTLN